MLSRLWGPYLEFAAALAIGNCYRVNYTDDTDPISKPWPTQSTLSYNQHLNNNISYFGTWVIIWLSLDRHQAWIKNNSNTTILIIMAIYYICCARTTIEWLFQAWCYDYRNLILLWVKTNDTAVSTWILPRMHRLQIMAIIILVNNYLTH